MPMAGETAALAAPPMDAKMLSMQLNVVRSQLKKVDIAEVELRKTKRTTSTLNNDVNNKLLATILKRRKATMGSDSEEEESSDSDIDDEMAAANPVLAIIAKKIGKLQKDDNEFDAMDGTLDSDSGEEWEWEFTVYIKHCVL